MPKKAALILLVLICFIGIGIRAYQLTARSLWFDEAFSWQLIQFPWTEMIARDAADVHPPLYYILLKSWSIVFGSSLLSIRSFSIAAAVVTIGFVYLLANEIWRSRTVGVTAALLTAVAGFQIQAAWEARMYTLGTALIVIAAWLLLRALQASSKQVWWWLGFAVATAAAIYTHYYLLFSLIAIVLFLVGYFLVTTRGRIGEILQWSQFWYALLAGGVIAGFFAVWMPTFLQQGKAVQSSFWIPAFSWWSIPDAFFHFFIPTANGLSHTGAGSIALLYVPFLIVVGIWMWLLIGGQDFEKPGHWLLLLLGVVPFMVSVGFSLSGRSVFQERYFIFAQIFILVALAGALHRLPWRLLRRGLLLGLLIGLLAADWSYWQGLAITTKPGAQAATQHLMSNYQAPEPIIVSSPFVYFSVLHYVAEDFDSIAPTYLYSETGELAHFAGGPILKPANIINQSVFTDPQVTSIWVVNTTGFGGSQLAVPDNWLPADTQHFPEVHGYQGDISVTRYQRERLL